MTPRVLLSVAVLLRTEEKEISKYTECQVHQKSEGREVNVKLPVVGADGKDLEHGEAGSTEYVNWPHVEVRTLFYATELANILFAQVPLP